MVATARSQLCVLSRSACSIRFDGTLFSQDALKKFVQTLATQLASQGKVPEKPAVIDIGRAVPENYFCWLSPEQAQHVVVVGDWCVWRSRSSLPVVPMLPGLTEVHRMYGWSGTDALPPPQPAVAQLERACESSMAPPSLCPSPVVLDVPGAEDSHVSVDDDDADDTASMGLSASESFGVHASTQDEAMGGELHAAQNQAPNSDSTPMRGHKREESRFRGEQL